MKIRYFVAASKFTVLFQVHQLCYVTLIYASRMVSQLTLKISVRSIKEFHTVFCLSFAHKVMQRYRNKSFFCSSVFI